MTRPELWLKPFRRDTLNYIRHFEDGQDYSPGGLVGPLAAGLAGPAGGVEEGPAGTGADAPSPGAGTGAATLNPVIFTIRRSCSSPAFVCT